MMIHKVLGVLLDYPSDEMIEALPEVASWLEGDTALPPPLRDALLTLVDRLESNDAIDVQEAWLALFERSRARSLHLYEHVHGESRDRGQAMVGLKELYRFHGVEIAQPELPDYLPLLCEFLSMVKPQVAASVLAEATHILEAIRIRLTEKASPYAAVFAALLHLAGTEARADAVSAVLAAEPDEEADDTEALDREWEEAVVSFGAGDALPSCAPRSKPHAA